MSNRLSFTRHAELRLSQRGLTYDDVQFIVDASKPIYRTGVKFYRLVSKQLPPDLPGNHPYRRLVDTTVVVCHCGSVITAYRNKNAHKKDRKKSPHSLRHTECEMCGITIDADVMDFE